MFETSVVRVRTTAGSYRYRFLTLSLGFHACAGAAVIAATLASTRLPDEAPRQMTTYLMPAVAPAPPPALGVQHPKPAVAKPASAPAAPRAIVAPQVIPDQTPATTVTTDAGQVSSTAAGDQVGPPGVPNGTPNGIGTDTNATPQAPDAAGPLPVVGDVKAPIVIHRVMPEYPRVALMSRMNGTVTVECIVDKTGRVRDVRLVKSSFAAFDQPAMDAVQKWTFAPGTLHGQSIDTIFQLTVVFQVQ